LQLSESILTLPFLDREVLAAVYRRAALVLHPSDAEGFGMPLLEAMGSGTPVVASDLQVLREIGGEAAIFCPVADVSTWQDTIAELLAERNSDPQRWAARQAAGLARAAEFSWAEYARKMVPIYQALSGG
jgi:glycosyltransferase involved in cell wall biosynthesis